MLGCAWLTKNHHRSHRQGGQQIGWVCTKAELLICMPWAFPGGYTKSANTSAWVFRIHICPMPPPCTISCSSVLFPELLCNISITFLSFLATPQGKAFTSSCTPPAPWYSLMWLTNRDRPHHSLGQHMWAGCPADCQQNHCWFLSIWKAWLALISRN